MLRNLFLAICLQLALLHPILAIDAAPVAEITLVGDNKVTGLELPANMTVSHDTSYVVITAKCDGPVQWLVLSTTLQPKFHVNPKDDHEITVGIPPVDATEISVFAVGVISGKPTGFARTDILVKGGSSPVPTPTPSPAPAPLPAGTRLHVTIIEDPNPSNRTPETAAILNSNAWRQAVNNQNGSVVRVYVSTDPRVSQKKLDTVLPSVGGLPAVIIQTDDGKVRDKFVLPKTEAELLARIRKLTGS